MTQHSRKWPGSRNLDPFKNSPIQFDLDRQVRRVERMLDVEGEWQSPATLTRLNLTKMSFTMLRRFEKKILPYDMGYRPGADTHWPGFDEPCWLWMGGLHPKGYGRLYLGEDEEGKKIWAYAHRIAFEHWVAIPRPGYIVDHECEVKTCCNPVHLWPQTNPENLRLANERRPWKRRNQYSKE
jgi:HNH endonuclease